MDRGVVELYGFRLGRRVLLRCVAKTRGCGFAALTTTEVRAFFIVSRKTQGDGLLFGRFFALYAARSALWAVLRKA